MCFNELEFFYSAAGNDHPNVETFIEMLGYMKQMGYTGVIFGLEDNFYLDDEPYFGMHRGKYTKDELKAINKACKDLGLNITPHFQNLGHIYNIGKFGTYFEYCDDAEVLLADDERTYVLVEKMLKVMRECFDTDRLHVGMDEAFQMGRGKHLDKHGYVPPFEIISKHLVRMRELCAKYGFTKLEMWSDMYLHNLFAPGFLDKPKEEVRAFVEGKIPNDVILGHWAYGLYEKEVFTDQIVKHLKMSDNISYTAAVLAWAGYVPDNSGAFRVFERNLTICKEQGIKKINIAAWTGTGFSNGLFAGLPAFYFAAELSYGRATGLDDLDKERFYKMFGVKFDDFMLLELANKPHPDFDYQRYNTKATAYAFQDPLLGVVDAFISENTAKDYEKVAEKLSKIKVDKFQYLFDIMAKLAKVLANKSELGLNMKKAYDAGDKKELKRIANEVIPVIIKDFNDLYLSALEVDKKEMIGIGLENISFRYGGMIKRLERIANRLNRYADGVDCEILELKDDRIKTYNFNGNPNQTENDFMLFGWNALTSFGHAANN